MNRHFLPITIALLALLLALTGCVAFTPTPGSGEPTPASDVTSGVFTTDAFSISYPEGWGAAPCAGLSIPVGHDRDLGAEARACLSTSKERGTYCIVFFKGTEDAAELDAAIDRIYREGADRAWRMKSEQLVTVDGRLSREIVFQKPHGEPYYAMRDVWVPAEGGAYIVTCLTYAGSYRTVNGQKVALADLYAPAFESILQSFDIKGEAPPTPTGQETAAARTTAGPTAAATAEVTARPTPGEATGGTLAGPLCRFSASGSGPNAGWTWLTDAAYRNEGLWECTGLPVDAPLLTTLTALVTNGSNGGSGYSAPVRVIAKDPAGGPEWTAQVYLQNPEPTQNPQNSHGAGYPTTGYFVLPANILGPDGALQLRVGRLAPAPYHVAVNGESLHFDAPRPASAYESGGPVIAGWTWLRDRADNGYGEWRFSGLQPGLPTVLALDLLVTDRASGGAGYSAPVALTVWGTTADAKPQMMVVQAQNLLFEEEPGDSGGRGYQAYGSLAVDPRLLDVQGEMVVRLNRPLETDRHVAVNANSVRVVQLGSTVGEGTDSAAGPVATVGPAGGATPVTPQDQASCEALGGRWGRIGLGPREQCNLPASDVGKECLSSSACEGLCLAELTRDELASVIREKKVIRATGKCSAWRIVVGCVPMVEDGLVQPICID